MLNRVIEQLYKEDAMRGGEIRFEFEIETVGGEEGRQLRLEQARAIREILIWSKEHRSHANNEGDERALHRPGGD